jgi:hypothetical protein
MDEKAIFHQLSLATRSTIELTAPQPMAVFADTKACLSRPIWRHYFRLARHLIASPARARSSERLELEGTSEDSPLYASALH